MYIEEKCVEVILPVLITAVCLLLPMDALAVDRTWDGGGATSNWSEAANWSGDTVPGASDAAIFDGTSTKNATIDTNFTLVAMFIQSGYTGAITQGASDLVVIAPFSQTTGTFIGGSGTLDVNGAFTLSGGTFTAPTGPVSFAQDFVVSSPGTFDPNGGTVVFEGGGDSFLSIPASFTLANLTINKTGTGTAGVYFDTTGTIIVTGFLTLAAGVVDNNNGTGTVEAQGAVSIGSTFSGGATLLISGPATRTVTLPVGAALPRMFVDAPNVTLKTSGVGTVEFSNPFTLSGGNFAPGSGNVTFSNDFTQAGGTFTGGSGALDFKGTFSVIGGTFTAPTGPVSFAQNFTVSGTGTFDPNGGTAVFYGGRDSFVSISGGLTLANLTINKTGTGTAGVLFNTTSTIVVTGDLVLADGPFENNSGTGTVEAQGAVSIASTFDGGALSFRFSGTADQTYTNSGGNNLHGPWTIDKSAGTVNLGSDLNLTGSADFNLINGTITTGVFVVDAGIRPIMRTNGYISGNLQRRFTSTGARTFDVGTANGYSPVGVNVTTLAVNPSDLRVGAVQTTHPNAPNPASALGRYWALTETGDFTATLVFNYLETDIPAVSESTLELKRYTGTGTVFDTIPATLDTSTNTATTTSGITDFSDWTLLSPSGPTAAHVSVGGRVVTDDGRGISKASLMMADMSGSIRSAITNPFGFYRFDGVTAGETYVVSVRHKSYEFANPTQTVSVTDAITDLNFTAMDPVATGAKGSIVGRVHDANGNGIDGVEIEISGGEMAEPVTVVTGKNGEYEIDGIKIGGTFILTARSKHLVVSVPTRVVVLEEDSATVDFLIAGPSMLPHDLQKPAQGDRAVKASHRWVGVILRLRGKRGNSPLSPTGKIARLEEPAFPGSSLRPAQKYTKE